MVKGGRYGVKEEEILKTLEQLIKEVEVEKLHIEYWKRSKPESTITDCLVKVSMEREWV